MKEKILEKYLELAYSFKNKLQIVLVCNVAGLTIDQDDFSENSITSEYLTLRQYNKILKSYRDEGFDVIPYFDENQFIDDVINKKIFNNNDRKLLVMNSAQKGTKVGRKSLIPAFCDLHNIYYSNSNAYVVSLCRDKFNSGCLLDNWGIPVPQSWLYRYSDGWLFNKKPKAGQKVIVKLNYETSSIGLDVNSIFVYDNSKDAIINPISKKYNQDVIIQEFISGYEIETSFINGNQPFVFPPMGIRINGNELMGDSILDYNARKNHPYDFYKLDKSLPCLSEKIKKYTALIGNALNITGIGRIDYRITPNQEIYITDIATNPGYGDYSSTFQVIKDYGYDYSEMLAIFIGVSLSKYIY